MHEASLRIKNLYTKLLFYAFLDNEKSLVIIIKNLDTKFILFYAFLDNETSSVCKNLDTKLLAFVRLPR